MMRSFGSSFQTIAVALAVGISSLTLSACGSNDEKAKGIEALDEKLAGKGSDPAMNAALEDRILVDPELSESANSNMVKVTDKPLEGAVPPDTSYEGDMSSSDVAPSMGKLMRAPKPRVVADTGSDGGCTSCGAAGRGQTLEDMAAMHGTRRGKGTCADKLQYGAAWSTRMPAEFPIYPKGRVKEAGGVEGGMCDIRAVSFSTTASMESVADYYYTRAKRAGYSADYELRKGEHIMGGTRDNDGGAFVVFLNPLPGGGTAVDLVANNGR
ncbi:MAG: hypothetical protein RL481_1646 [Pseudomonadota bacterium]